MSAARFFIGFGLLSICIGLLLLLTERWNLPIGRLPGDLVWRSKSTTVYFPWETCLVISLLLTVVAWFVNRRR